jgi:hypothetical protein
MKQLVRSNIWATGALSVLLALPFAAQAQTASLEGNWKYLRNFTYVNVDDQARVFQCRILPDLNVFTSTGVIGDDSIVSWEAVRFFSLYGQEVSPSGQDWASDTIELRRLVMFLHPVNPGPNSQSMEFDRVPLLPTICAHYLSTAFD